MSKEGMEVFNDVFKKFISWFVSKVKGGKAMSAAFNSALDIAPHAIPIIDTVAQIAAGLTPSKMDDAMIALIHQKYPKLFTGEIQNGDELKLYLFGAAASALQARFPTASESVIKLAVQAAYLGQKIEQKEAAVQADKAKIEGK